MWGRFHKLRCGHQRHSIQGWVGEVDLHALAVMELVLRLYLNSRRSSEVSGLHQVVEKVTSDEEVLFTGLWSLSWEEEVSQVLLPKIAEHWM